MAFCPECGKAVTAEAASCAACGNALPNAKKAAAAARFNGTVMMAAPVSVKAVEPANVNAEVAAKAAAAQASSSAAVPAQARIAVGAGPAPAVHAAKLPAAKATMLGAGIAPHAPAEPHAGPSVRAVVDVPVSPVPERPENVAHAPTPVAPANAAPPVRPAQPARPVQQTAREGAAQPAPHYLPGDPMAPQPSAAEPSPYGRSQRLHIDHEPAPTVPKDERIWLYWAVCGVVVLSVLVLAMGLF